MRYREFELTEDELFELKMSPTNLAKMAKNIDARVGMEFELIVPNTEVEDEEFDPVPDYDADERFPTGPGWTNEIMSFFRGGEVSNSTRSIQRATDELNENFYDWVGEQEEEFIASNEGQERAIEIATSNVSRDDFETDEEYETAVREYLTDNEDDIRDKLIDEFREDLDSKFEEWLDDNGIGTMSDFANEHSLEWPYWTQPDDYYGGSGLSINAVADDFSQAIGRPVNASTSYHGAYRQPGHYVVEPDSSLHGDEPGDGGLEFVSPPLTVAEMLEDIDRVAAWAGRAGAYTNDSTGLHMNVSVPEQKNLDFVKLAMFLGDNYILEQFGREGNTYCKSILKNIKTIARNEPERVTEMMRQFQSGLSDIASKVLHTGQTQKYSSINNRGDWIEFRGPGNDWLDEDLGLVKNTLLRAVVATDVATKPEEFKQEYYKKLYKTLAQGKEDDTIQYFAKYAAGELPQSALKAFVRQIQGKRKVDKLTHGAKDIMLVWRVTGSANSPYQSQGTEVIAPNEYGAYKQAIAKWSRNNGFYIGNYNIEQWAQEHGWRAQPLRAATTDDMNAMSEKFYRVYVQGRSDGVWIRAMSEFQAKQLAVQRFSDIFANAATNDIMAINDPNYEGPETPFNLRGRSGEPEPVGRQTLPQPPETVDIGSMPSRDQEFTGHWEVVSRNTDEVVSVISGIGNAVADAERHAARWQQQTGFDDPVYVRPLMRPRDNLSRNQGEVDQAQLDGEPISGSTLDRVRQRAEQIQGFRVSYTVTYAGEVRNNTVTIQARNADAAMDVMRTNLQRAGYTVDRIEAEPVAQSLEPPPEQVDISMPGRGTESLPPGNTRWLVLDQNDREVYSFIARSDQAEANQYAINWLRGNNMIGHGEFMVVPAR